MASKLEGFFEAQLRAVKAPAWVREHTFHPERRWRWDFAWPAQRLALEIQGGGEQGAHMRHQGYRNDVEKLNEATLMGWRVLWATTDMVWNGDALDAVERALGLPRSPRRPLIQSGRRAARPRASRAGRTSLHLPG